MSDNPPPLLKHHAFRQFHLNIFVFKREIGLGDNVVIEQEETFESIDKPLSGGEKIRFGILVTFMYGIFIVAVVLTAYYNT